MDDDDSDNDGSDDGDNDGDRERKKMYRMSCEGKNISLSQFTREYSYKMVK